jgi:ABC-2 type transport system ATP-binding protein
MVLQAKKLLKSFDHKVVLDEVSFDIARGEIIGIVGSNGSGKTTLLNILMGMLRPNGGTYQFAEGTKVGMAVSRKGFFDDMSVRNNILLNATQMQLDAAHLDGIMRDFEIDFGNKLFGELSAGMKQRVALAIPFLRHNDLFLLDEPTNHLDIDSIFLLRAKILKKKSENASFIITSHALADLEKVCDRIIFLKKGKVIAEKNTIELLNTYRDLEDAYINIFDRRIS